VIIGTFAFSDHWNICLQAEDAVVALHGTTEVQSQQKLKLQP